MHDLSFFRSHLDQIATRLTDRGFPLDVAQFRALDTERRSAVTEAEQLKAQKNVESMEIGKLKKAGEDTSGRQRKVNELNERIKALDEKVSALDAQFREMLASVPN